MNIRRIARRALLAATALLVLVPAAAHAAEDRLALSSDGVTWHDTLTDPIFGTDVQWVPGDVRSAAFYVRNQGDGPGTLDVDVVRTTTDALLDTGYLTISARAGDGAWTPTDEDGVHALVEGASIADGARVRVQVRAALAADAPNGTMLLASDLNFRVRLTDAAATEPTDGTTGPNGGDNADGGDGGDGTSLLPATGSGLRQGLVWLGLALTGLGAFLMTRRRERRTETSHA